MSADLEVTLLGHAAVLLKLSCGSRLVIDPYEPGGLGGTLLYRALQGEVDAAICTHDHADHCALHALAGSPTRLHDESSWRGVTIRRHTADHDEYGGRRFGGQVELLELEVEGARIVHLSDVGHGPQPALVEALFGADLVCVPVGGFYTIGAAQAAEWCERLGARWVMPCHYASAGCTLPIQGVEVFMGVWKQRRPGARVVRDAVMRGEVLRHGEGGVWWAPMMCLPDEGGAR